MPTSIRRPIDRMLLFFALMLMCVGFVWIFSASAVKTLHSNSLASTFLARQSVGALLGLVALLWLSQTELGLIEERPRWLLFAYLGVVLLLLSVFAFPKINNAHRWIKILSWSFQPSELFKPLSVVLVSWWMVRHQDAWKETREAVPKLLTLLGILFLPLGLIVVEPDLGTTFMILMVSVVLIFLGGAPKWIFAVLLPALGAILGAFIWLSPHARARILAFFNPEADPLGKGHQIIQSLVAVGNGGLTGVGLGAGRQKLFFLPEAHTDFIFAVLAEEVGLLGTFPVLLLYVGILWRGYRVAIRTRNAFLRLCATGFVLLIVVQAFFNLSVVLSLAPNKGIPLPFVSYGPSSLVATLMCLGLLLSISKDSMN